MVHFKKLRTLKHKNNKIIHNKTFKSKEAKKNQNQNQKLLQHQQHNTVEPGDPEITEILNTDNNTSLNLTAYKIPNEQNTTLIDPKTEFNDLRYVKTIKTN